MQPVLSRHLWYFSEMLICVLTSAPLLSSKKDNPTNISEKYLPKVSTKCISGCLHNCSVWIVRNQFQKPHLIQWHLYKKQIIPCAKTGHRQGSRKGLTPSHCFSLCSSDWTGVGTSTTSECRLLCPSIMPDEMLKRKLMQDLPPRKSQHRLNSSL